jgi:hypothetical protein
MTESRVVSFIAFLGLMCPIILIGTLLWGAALEDNGKVPVRISGYGLLAWIAGVMVWMSYRSAVTV